MRECVKPGNHFNFIIAGGSIPPMLAALEAILNGNETYVYIGRGRLYNGIENTLNFHNLGFDVNKTRSLETEELFLLSCSKIKEIKSHDENAFFNFYIDESRAMKAAAIAANAGLKKTDFHVYMLEDGIDTYKKFALHYAGKPGYRTVKRWLLELTGREWFSSHAAELVSDALHVFTVKQNSIIRKFFNNIVLKDFEKTIVDSAAHFDALFSSCENSYDNPMFCPNYKTPFAIACHDNFTYMIQNKSKIDNILISTGNKRMLSLFSVPGYESTKGGPEIISESIYQKVNKLNEKQKKRYMTLMFCEYEEELNKNFDRETRSGEPAPHRKLVYVSSRIDTMFAKPVTGSGYGIGGITNALENAVEYEKLDNKYKSVFLFQSREDFEILSDEIKSFIIESDAPYEIKSKAAEKVFNLYADYVFVAKMLYMIYGEDYDLIVKNHPRTDLGTSAEWADSYKIRYEGGYIDCGMCLDKALTRFFKEDSVGRYIGVLSGSLSTENFEYFGKDVSFGGQPSSVYNGLSEEANIVFIITDTNDAVSGGGNSHFDFSAVSGLYYSGLLKYRDSSSKLQNTAFYNTGNILKVCSQIAREKGCNELARFYKKKFNEWLVSVHTTASDIDIQGFPIE